MTRPRGAATAIVSLSAPLFALAAYAPSIAHAQPAKPSESAAPNSPPSAPSDTPRAPPTAASAAPTAAPSAAPPPAGPPSTSSTAGQPGAPPRYAYYPPPPYGYQPCAPPGEQRPARVWYGWQSLIVHGVSASLLAVSPVSDGAGAGFTVSTALTGMVLAAPIVHWAHGHTSRGFASLGIQLGGILVGGLSGGATACGFGGCEGSYGFAGFILGSAIGASVGSLTAFVIDVSVLSFDERSDQTDLDHAKGRGRSPSFALVPTFDIQPGRSVLGVAGAF